MCLLVSNSRTSDNQNALPSCGCTEYATFIRVIRSLHWFPACVQLCSLCYCQVFTLRAVVVFLFSASLASSSSRDFYNSLKDYFEVYKFSILNCFFMVPLHFSVFSSVTFCSTAGSCNIFTFY